MTEPGKMSDDGTAALERELLGGGRRYTRTEVAEQAGVPVEHARRLWRALGFPDVDDNDVSFTEMDVEALRTVQSLVDRGIVDGETQLAMTRAMAQSLARLAEWQVSALTTLLAKEDSDGVAAPEGVPAAAATEAATEAARELVPVMAGLIGYVWRRHLAAAAVRALANPAEVVARSMAVGFAGLVGYTSLPRHVDEQELAQLIERFESIAADVIAQHGGRIVKTVGDEVMYVADDAVTAAEVAVQLLDEVTASEILPDLRVGVAFGTVLARLGDIYGEPVNIASRLTSIARPGSVLVDRELASAIEEDERFKLRRVPPRPVRGYALLQPMRLRRAELASTS